MINLVFILIIGFVSFFTGFLYKYISIIIIISLHEIMHAITARIFKLKIEKINFTPIGHFIVIKNMEFLQPYKKIIIILSGPILNIVLGLLNLIVFKNKFPFLTEYNFALAIFNLIPALPLDGGRLLQVLLGNHIGVLNTNKLLINLNKIIAILFIVLGIVQVILYPFNISLLLIGVYIHKSTNKEVIKMTVEFYKVLIDKSKNIRKKLLPTKTFVSSKNTSIKYVLNRLSWDKYFIIHIFEKGKLTRILTETEIIEYTVKYGVNGKLIDILMTA